jgi:hypothetical protein
MARTVRRSEVVEGVHLVENGVAVLPGWTPCVIKQNITFSTKRLQEYCFVPWEPIIYDVLLVAAAVEFCDKLYKRPTYGWRRTFAVRIPVHEPERWSAPAVSAALIDALEFLTGDKWQFEFYARVHPESPPRETLLNFPSAQRCVMPFSDGMDSRAVGGLLERDIGDRLIRVRMGAKTIDRPSSRGQPGLFTSIPYRVRPYGRDFKEGSGRSRGFKFAIASALTAYLLKAQEIALPESGQGALGPALLAVGQAYEDYRNHPFFTDRMEKLVAALLEHEVRYDFPRLWFTKGETLKAYATAYGDRADWANTRSCWQQTRHVSVAQKQRQCGVCAACMLRRLSVHAAGLSEEQDRYVWERLCADTYHGGAAHAFTRHTGALKEYAIAGVLHMDHMAGLATSPLHAADIKRHAAQLAVSRGLNADDAHLRLTRLLRAHAAEWHAFVHELGERSFVRSWVSL